MANPTSKLNLVVNGVTTSYDIHDANAIPRSGGAVISGNTLGRTVNAGSLSLQSGTNSNGGASIAMYGKDTTDSASRGVIVLKCFNDSNSCVMRLYPNGTATWNDKNFAMQEDTIPRSGGAVISGGNLARTIDTDALFLCGGTGWQKGGCISMKGQSNSIEPGLIEFYPSASSIHKSMKLYPDGTWTWSGTACQITSDQRLKQQITEIDDKLLDAWEDVELCQFKYNDAVDQKGDTARLHTGYVVQQIDNACKSHGVDVSQYGLYCHEEYPQETEEVEVTQKDGTKTKERKVIREASEHYSLRYTEALIVECKYLRRCVERLTARIEELEKGNNK